MIKALVLQCLEEVQGELETKSSLNTLDIITTTPEDPGIVTYADSGDEDCYDPNRMNRIKLLAEAAIFLFLIVQMFTTEAASHRHLPEQRLCSDICKSASLLYNDRHETCCHYPHRIGANCTPLTTAIEHHRGGSSAFSANVAINIHGGKSRPVFGERCRTTDFILIRRPHQHLKRGERTWPASIRYVRPLINLSGFGTEGESWRETVLSRGS